MIYKYVMTSCTPHGYLTSPAPLMILSNFVFGPLPWSRKLCLRNAEFEKRIRFLGELLKMAR